MRHTIALCTLAGAAFLTPILATAQEAAPEATSAEATDVAPAVYDARTVLATIDGTEITLGHVIMMRERLPEQYQSVPDDVLYEGILEQMIDQHLLGTRVVQGDDMPLAIRLTLENESRGVLANAAVEEFSKIEFDEAAIQAAYDAEFGALEPEPEFNASHILVETEDEAREVVAALEGGADFAELAGEKSIGPSGPQGGALGWFGLGMMVPEFETVAVALDAGAISAPVQTQFGWHVIKMLETRNKPLPTLEETHDELVLQLRQKALEEDLAELRAAATIEKPDLGIPTSAIRESDLLGK